MRGFLILLSVLLVLKGNEAYEQLNQHERRIVDKAIKQANEELGKQQHLDYSSILQANNRIGMLHVLLKPTSCEKKTEVVHQGDCEIREKAKPQVSCVACHEEMNCFLLREHEKTTKKINDCFGKNLITGGVVLSQSGKHEQKTGCLGCI
ncbi:uncharacterized protein LOC100170809 precursor [Danio rerio]|uniref:Si:dkeyp-73d8.6 n=1 Tax=Danio rerio TaxID=7955 RepID=B0S631_DANRE|nr:uncharacterized protein LOC100170809 precursor [Danio rerio]AAI63820.1 Si:dkeyp-73d8.6 [Danio rerio]AAI63841.1 Si:dkeyp-73d8.6 [Danio rerio]|eukprot:NP_001124116.1 uncharacterized protein LOC100170809 precursor [Danio rerio]